MPLLFQVLIIIILCWFTDSLGFGVDWNVNQPQEAIFFYIFLYIFQIDFVELSDVFFNPTIHQNLLFCVVYDSSWLKRHCLTNNSVRTDVGIKCAFDK